MELSDDADINPLSLLNGANDKLQKVFTSYLLGKNAIFLVKDWYSRYTAEVSYNISVSSTDAIFNDVAYWLMTQIPEKKLRSVVALTTRIRNSRYWETDTGIRTESELKLMYDGTRVQSVNLNGHKIKVSLTKDSPTLGDGGVGVRVMKEEKITLTARTKEARDEVVKLLKDITSSQATKPPAMWTAKTWGNWQNDGKDIPVRNIDSVILRKDQKEDLIEDLKNFLQKEEDYVRLGMPYHRGYLFHGPPGTGKTSAAKALASHMGLDVYYLSLPAMEKDSSLNELMGEIQPRSILLIEDIDIAHGAKDRDDDHKGVSLSGLLNALDGFMTPHGLITIMTTNNLEVLDPALVRPGRVDRIEHINYVDDWQLRQLVKTFLHEDVDWEVKKEVSAAQIVEVILKNLDDTPGALKGIREII